MAVGSRSCLWRFMPAAHRITMVLRHLKGEIGLPAEGSRDL